MKVQIPDPTPISGHTPKKYNVLVYGRSGTGKTEFCATWPKPLLFIDTDKGITTVVSSPRVQEKDQIFLVDVQDRSSDVVVKQPIGFATVETVLKSLATENSYSGVVPQTVVLDSLTTTSALTMSRTLYLHGHVGQQPTLPDYGRLMRDLLDIITTGIGLRCNFIATAHEQYTKDELSGRIWCGPLIVGKLAAEISLYFDEVYHANVRERGGKHEYMLDTKASGLITAKSRLDLPSPIIAHFDSIKGTIERLNSTRKEVSHDIDK